MPEPAAPRRALLQPNAQHRYQVTREDLPLACPMPEMYLWNSHPRVYLPIEATGWAKCSYCGAEYHLEGANRGEPLPDVQMS
jgi:uncharacterized Zn-finger protein